MEIAVYGPQPRPDVLHRIARDRAEAQQRAIDTRADTNIACPSCGSNIYDGAYGYCPSCGFERTNNGHIVELGQRSATAPAQTCGHCGIPLTECWHGW
jgi:ribosomal protein L37E